MKPPGPHGGKLRKGLGLGSQTQGVGILDSGPRITVDVPFKLELGLREATYNDNSPERLHPSLVQRSPKLPQKQAPQSKHCVPEPGAFGIARPPRLLRSFREFRGIKRCFVGYRVGYGKLDQGSSQSLGLGAWDFPTRGT